MTVEYAPRAVRDLEEIGAYYRDVAGSAVAEAIADRIARVIGRLESHPESAPRVTGRRAIRADADEWPLTPSNPHPIHLPIHSA